MRAYLVATALVVVACTSPRASDHDLATTREPIIDGSPSTETQDFVVMLARRNGGVMVPLCTGTLVAKNLVLTARHCTGNLTADEDHIAPFDPSEVKIYVGLDAGPQTVSGAPIAQGTRFFDNGKDDLIPDVALVLLDAPIDAPIVPIRLDSGAVAGEQIDLVGYGLTELNRYPRQRLQRTVTVEAAGPGKSRLFDLLLGEFAFGEGACSGDSGGPAIATESGAVIGVASYVGNGAKANGSTLADACIGTTAEDVYADLVSAKDIVDAAFEGAGAEPWLEGQPSPDEKAAAAKAAADKAAADKKAASGCSASASRESGMFGWLLVTIAGVLLGRRRRARRRRSGGSPV